MYTIKRCICKVELALSVQFCTNVRTYVTTFDNCVQNVYISLCPLLLRPLHTHARTLTSVTELRLVLKSRVYPLDIPLSPLVSGLLHLP